MVCCTVVQYTCLLINDAHHKYLQATLNLDSCLEIHCMPNPFGEKIKKRSLFKHYQVGVKYPTWDCWVWLYYTDFRPPCSKGFVYTFDLPSFYINDICWSIFTVKNHFSYSKIFFNVKCWKIGYQSNIWSVLVFMTLSCYATNLTLFRIYSGTDTKLFIIL